MTIYHTCLMRFSVQLLARDVLNKFSSSRRAGAPACISFFAMTAPAPKHAKVEAAASPQEECIKSEKIEFHNLSIAIDSSWRSLDQEHCDTLCAQIKEGKWGRTTLSRPSVRMQDKTEPMLSSVDGKAKLRNGKHIIAALLRIEKEHLAWDAAQPSEGKPATPWDWDLPWLTRPLKAVYKEGLLLVDFMLATDPNDEAAYVALQVIVGLDRIQTTP